MDKGRGERGATVSSWKNLSDGHPVGGIAGATLYRATKHFSDILLHRLTEEQYVEVIVMAGLCWTISWGLTTVVHVSSDPVPETSTVVPFIHEVQTIRGTLRCGAL